MTVRLVTAIPAPEEEKVRPSAPVAVVAADLGADPSTIRKLIKAGQLEAWRLGKCGIRVYLDSVARYQTSHPVKAQKGAKAAEKQTAEAPPGRSRATRAAHSRAVGSLQALGLMPISRR